MVAVYHLVVTSRMFSHQVRSVSPRQVRCSLFTKEMLGRSYVVTCGVTGIGMLEAGWEGPSPCGTRPSHTLPLVSRSLYSVTENQI